MMKTITLEQIDFEKVNALLEGFNKLTGFVTAILDLNGNVLSKSGWRQICTEFHRINPETSKRCTISDTVLAGKIAADEKYHFYKCLNGLVDVAVPIVIRGEHIANLFSGQFFFEEPDSNFFDKQAEKYGFDKSIYLKALGDVPVFSEEKVKTAMGFLLNMTQLISEMTLQKMEQIELNEKLSKNNLLIDSIIDNSNALIYVTDREGRFQMVNKELEHLFSMHKTELIGKLRNDFMPKKIADQHRKNDLAVIQSKKSITIEEEDLKSDGKHYYLTQKFPIFGKNGEVQRIGGISTDITNRKQAEEALRLSEDYFKNIFEYSTVGMSITTVDGKLMTNKAFGKVLGYSDEELNKTSWDSITHPDDIETNQRNLESIHSGVVPSMRWEKRYIHKDGHIVWVDISTVLQRANDWNPLYFITTIQDITERKLAEITLRDEKDQIRTILDMVGDPIFVKDNNHRITLANRAFYDIFSMDESSVIGYTLVEAVPENERHHFLKVDRRVLDTGIPDIREEELTVGDNKHYIITRKIRFTDESGERFLVGSIHDITERKLAEEKLILANSRLRSFIDSNIIGVVIATPDGKIVETNDYYLKTIGFTRQEFEAGEIDWIALTPPEWLPVEEHAIQEMREEGTCTPYEKEYLRRDGTRIAVLLADAMLPGLEHQIVAFVLDITEQKLAEATLHETQAILQAAMDQSPAGIAIANAPNGDLRYVNKAGLLIRGGDYEEIVENIDINDYLGSWHILDLDGVPLKPEEVPLARAVLFGEENSREFIIRRAIGDDRIIFANAAPIRDNKEKVIAGIVVFLDITDRKHSEEEISKQLDELRRWYEVTLDREGRVLQLKQEVNELLKQHGEALRYGSAIQDDPDATILS